MPEISIFYFSFVCYLMTLLFSFILPVANFFLRLLFFIPKSTFINPS